MRKRFISFLTCIILTLALFAPVYAGAGDSTEKLIVGVPSDRCPIFYRDSESGEVVGIGVDLMRTAAEEAGFDPSFQFVTESSLKEALDSNEYDVVLPFGSAIDSAEGQASIVSDNLFQTPFTLVTLGDRELPPINELKVGMVASLAGGADTVRQLYPGIEIMAYETMDKSIWALKQGKVDALLHNSYVWSYVLQKPSYSRLKVQPASMFSMDFRAGTLDTPEGQKLIERLNKGIAQITDPRRQAVILDYTGRRLYRYDLFDYVYQYGLVALATFFLLALLAAVTMLRRRAAIREQEEKMQRLVDQDPLTGIYSLVGFRKRAEELLRRNPDTPYLISYNNLRNFKFVNDSLGWEAGDALLRFWAEKTMDKLSDDEAMGRVAADRFVIMRRVRSDEEMQLIDKEVYEPVSSYFVDRGKEYMVRVCRGIYVLTPDDYLRTDIDRMMDFARVAEKKAGNNAKGGYCFYNPDQWEKEKLSADICGHLQAAIQSGEIEVWYQPQVDFDKGVIYGAEALCRWNHYLLGWISPADFIPILEEAGLISKLDEFVWNRVCEDLARWKSQGDRRIVSVNLSRSDITEDRDIVKVFTDLINKYGLSMNQLRIEITETAFTEDSDLLLKATAGLRKAGFMVEMDDFGSGYSSLHMLKEVPMDKIKMDLHFLTDSGDMEKGRIIIDHIIQMVTSLGMELIAEGVETMEQAVFLRSKGCPHMQGFYFYKPMPVDEFEKLDTKL